MCLFCRFLEETSTKVWKCATKGRYYPQQLIELEVLMEHAANDVSDLVWVSCLKVCKLQTVNNHVDETKFQIAWAVSCAGCGKIDAWP